MVLPIPEIPWPFPTPPLSGDLEMVLLTVVGVAGFVMAWSQFHGFAYPRDYTPEKLRKTLWEFTGATAYFLWNYVQADPWGAIGAAAMLIFEAIRLRLGISMRQILALVIATVRRIVREIRKRLP